MFILQGINIFDKTFEYFLIKDIDYLLQNVSIEKTFSMASDLKMLNSGYIDHHSEIMWKLFLDVMIDFSKIDSKKNSNIIKLKIRNEEIKEFIKEKIF